MCVCVCVCVCVCARARAFVVWFATLIIKKKPFLTKPITWKTLAKSVGYWNEINEPAQSEFTHHL